jgi:NAD(P)-dependent dehydrogenase (short-subunit alcohol dehydrogenase family)
VAKVAAKIEALGRRALPVTCDVTDPDACLAAADQVAAELGGIDVLVANAYHDGDFSSVMDADLSAWRTTMDVNFFGAVHMTRAVVPHMKARGGGRIVMVNTMSTERIEPGFGAYAASKAALKSITRTLAKELGRDGIRVNGVHPGYIWGDSVEQYFRYQADRRGITFEERYAETAAETSLGYLPHSSEIAGAILFLASDLAKPITGQALHVNAGHWFEGF